MVEQEPAVRCRRGSEAMSEHSEHSEHNERRRSGRGLALWRDRGPVIFEPWRWFDELLDTGEGRRMIRVEEYTDGDELVVRAELPDIDPERDVEVTVADHTLHISAERTETSEESGRHFHRRELRTGSFARSIALPDTVDDQQVHASYRDGILEVRVAVPERPGGEAVHRVPVTRG